MHSFATYCKKPPFKHHYLPNYLYFCSTNSVSMYSTNYRIANHCFNLQLPSGFIPDEALEAYLPFRISDEEACNPLFTLCVCCEDTILPAIESSIISFNDENGEMKLFRAHDGGIIFHLSLDENNVSCKLHINKEYTRAIASVVGNETERGYALDNSLMLMFAFATAPLDTLLIHASVIENNGWGYIFLGKSGTGKSTHSRLWLKHITGSTLLNDDNPVLRIVNNTPIVYGSPWSGKTPCYKNRQVPVGAIVRLTQAPHNRIQRLSIPLAYSALMPSCSRMKWDEAMATATHSTIDKLITNVPLFRLECLPNEEAAHICSQTIR